MSEEMRLRIVSDGTPAGTKVLDEEGRRLRNVKAIAWGIDTDGMARLRIEVAAVPVDLIGEVDTEADVSMIQVPNDFTTPQVEVRHPEEPPTAMSPNGPVPPPPAAS